MYEKFHVMDRDVAVHALVLHLSTSQRRRRPQELSPAPSSPMLWGISSLVTVLLNPAARALPQGDLGDLLQLGPGFDEPEPDLQTLLIPTTHRTEQVSALPRVEHTTSAFPQLTTHAAQLTIAITGVSPHPYLTPTQSPTSRPPTPTSAGNSTYASVISTSNAIQNTVTTSTWYPSPTPTAADSALSQGQAVDWRVIGIAVIAISAVGTVILLVVFFDQWWGFLCDVCGRRRKRRGGGKEELVPDWERGTWEYKVEKDNLNLPMYPSFGSPPAQQMLKGAATHIQQWKVDIDQRPDPNMSPDCSAFPIAGSPKDSNQILSTQRVPRGVVDQVTTNKFHSPLSRSNTQRSATLEDAYDGLAT